jgi:hypothetical protein
MSGTHEILLPLPQSVDAQVPLCFFVHGMPPEAVLDYQLRKREGSTDVVSVRVKADRNQEVQFEWSAVVLIAGKSLAANSSSPEPFRKASGCVQAESAAITKLAQDLWPASGRVTDFAGSIQQFVREMKQKKPPRSLDALGILDSGMNGICTANANLALALLRARGIASRSVAVIPPVSQRLEMHRVVEYFHDGQWHSFDPSSLHADIPLNPWHSVIMAKTTMADEDLAMKPRMGAMVGSPYAQELEMLGSGVTPWGQDFFWTMARPLATFPPDDAVVSRAKVRWNQYLQTGKLHPSQIKARSATSSAELLDMLTAE